jgi:hypothetical protein
MLPNYKITIGTKNYAHREGCALCRITGYGQMEKAVKEGVDNGHTRKPKRKNYKNTIGTKNYSQSEGCALCRITGYGRVEKAKKEEVDKGHTRKPNEIRSQPCRTSTMK